VARDVSDLRRRASDESIAISFEADSVAIRSIVGEYMSEKDVRNVKDAIVYHSGEDGYEELLREVEATRKKKR
jgi:hypothetical protein